ncbi:MAG: hypothetical protein OXI96_09255, partial [Acidimicrobiaceae bacterium]|nr:hypothetical protein [Acidimicrobiaceae bacterium]
TSGSHKTNPSGNNYIIPLKKVDIVQTSVAANSSSYFDNSLRTKTADTKEPFLSLCFQPFPKDWHGIKCVVVVKT